MGKKALKWLFVSLLFFVVIGLAILVGLIPGLAGTITGRRKSPQSVIRSALAADLPESTIRNWIAISAHETDDAKVGTSAWDSRVYNDANNLFGMTLAKSNTTAIGELPYGEHQAKYKSIEDSAADQLLYMQKRFHYPTSFANLSEHINYMKSKGYFTDSVSNYLAGVTRQYARLEQTNAWT